jgi:hypothetical protein
LAAPGEPLGAVYAGTIDVGPALVLAVLAFLVGLIAYFASWPYGREIGILAVPMGLAIWAVRSGSMGALLAANAGLEQRGAVFSGLCWEPLFWLAIGGVGFAGVLVGQKIRSAERAAGGTSGAKSADNNYLNGAIALIGSVLVAQLCLRIFVQDIRASAGEWGSVVGQPAVGQIAFGVIVSFGVAAFLVKKFLGVSYIWPAMGSALVTAFSVSIYARAEVLERMFRMWPSSFFANSALSILPLQMVSFGVLGSIAGYWMAVRYSYWREHP